MDTHKEAIMKNLLTIAKLIRIPDIMGAAGKGKNNRRAQKDIYLGVYHYLGEYVGVFSKVGIINRKKWLDGWMAHLFRHNRTFQTTYDINF